MLPGEVGVGAGQVAAHGHEGHGFHAAAHGDVGPARHDAHGAQGDGLEARGAEAVDGGAADRLGKSSDLGGDAADIEALFGLGKGAADHDIVDHGGGEARGLFHG